jgi:broad specificity phosphatase PhoE
VTTTVLHLVRHASYDGVDEILVGRTPVHLNATGESEAAAVAAELAHCELAAVFSSPQLRARQTADAIASRQGQTVTIEPGLDEIDFGAWTGRPFASLADNPAWRAFNSTRSFAPVPAGEPMLAAQARAVATVQRLLSRFPESEIAAVSHADVIKSVLTYALGMSLDLMHRITLAPASRCVLLLEDGRPRIAAINLPPTS